MGTIADKLAYLDGTKTAIRDAIAAKGVDIAESDPFRSYAGKIDSIPGGWQPQPDWWDIKSIYEADTPPEGYGKRYIYLLSDSGNTTLLYSGGYAYKTSDGVLYTPSSSVTHTWNRAYDKPCALGYKTRWVMVYKAARDVDIFLTDIKSLWLYLGDCNVAYLQAGMAVGSANNLLQAVECSAETTASKDSMVESAFENCSSLVTVTLPNGPTVLGGRMFQNCYALTSVSLPGSVTSLGPSMFYSCSSLTSVVLPENINTTQLYTFQNCYSLRFVTLPSRVMTVATTAFKSCYALASIRLPDNFTGNISNGLDECSGLQAILCGPGFNGSLILRNSPLLSVSSMVAFFGNLKDNTGLTAKTLTLGSANLAKLTAAEKAIATSKNWILA